MGGVFFAISGSGGGCDGGDTNFCGGYGGASGGCARGGSLVEIGPSEP